jgi:hypothetical protein
MAYNDNKHTIKTCTEASTFMQQKNPQFITNFITVIMHKDSEIVDKIKEMNTEGLLITRVNSK